MADCCVSRKPNSLQRIYNPVNNSGYSCPKCTELYSQLEETRKELSSFQLIIKLLCKEINDITAEKKPTPSNTISELQPVVDDVSSNKWSSVTSKRTYNKNKAINPDIYPKISAHRKCEQI